MPTEPLLSSKGVVVALADGISSSEVSQVASAAAVKSFLDDYYCTSEAWSVRRSGQCVLEATNSWLHAQTQRSPYRFDLDRGYVCTFTALIIKSRTAHLFHVGDARLYQVHGQSLEQLTTDHRERASATEIYLARALGMRPQLELDYRTIDLAPGDLFLLATDGVYEHVDPATVHAALLASPDDLEGAAKHLVHAALEAGSDDNLTAQFVRVDQLPDAELRELSREGARLRPPPELAPRMEFEGYRILQSLHRSHRSHVFLAQDMETNEVVVIKTPAVDLQSDPDLLDRFALEEWIARRIDNPHVLQARPPQRQRQHLYVVMEYIDGQSLAQWMVDHPLPPLQSVRHIVEQVAKGLQAFHRREMLHRDVRPENIMIDASGTVKIVDFGSTWVAGLAEAGLNTQDKSELAGTLQFAAPETFLGQPGTERSDVFSLAVLTYQMLTGQLPYGLEVTRVRQHSDLHRLHYIPVRHHRTDLPEWIDAVLRKALHPQDNRRTEALSALVQDLRQPGTEFFGRTRTALTERNPLVFWQSLSAVLGLVVLALLMWMARVGH